MRLLLRLLVHTQNTTKNKKNKTKLDTEKLSVSENLIPGVDSSIFEKFRKKFNLKKTESADEDKKLDTLDSVNSTSVAKAYQHDVSSDESENFDEECFFYDKNIKKSNIKKILEN